VGKKISHFLPTTGMESLDFHSFLANKTAITTKKQSNKHNKQRYFSREQNAMSSENVFGFTSNNVYFAYIEL